MIKCNLLNLSLFWNFYNESMLNLIFFGTAKKDCAIKAREMVSFFPLINSSVTVGLSFLLLSISAIISSNTTNIS